MTHVLSMGRMKPSPAETLRFLADGTLVTPVP